MQPYTTSPLPRPLRRDKEGSDTINCTCSNRDRHTPLTPPGLKGQPSWGQTPSLHAPAQTTPTGGDDWYDTAPPKSSPTRWSYGPTHYGMGCTTRALTFKTGRPTRDLDLAIRGRGHRHHDLQRQPMTRSSCLLPHYCHDATRRTGEDDDGHNARDCW
jgi:hypothetical protein